MLGPYLSSYNDGIFLAIRTRNCRLFKSGERLVIHLSIKVWLGRAERSENLGMAKNLGGLS